MSLNISIELQKAIFKALSSDYSVYEVAPKGAKYPYIQIGEIERTTNNTKSSIRHIYNVYIHTWSEGTSSSESKVLNQYVNDRIMYDFRIPNLELGIINLRSERTLTEHSLDKNIYHGVLYFEITIIQ